MKNCDCLKKYNIKRFSEGEEVLSLDNPIWESAEVGFVECENWDGYSSAPKTYFRILRGKAGFNVHFYSDEKNLRAVVTEQNGNVYEDSCIEFFFKPDMNSENYFNFEFNPKGVLHLGFGKNRFDRLLIDVSRDVFHIESSANDGDWRLSFYIPDEFLLKYFDEISEGLLGNFYKCGELTGHSHYASWVRIDTESPDFHRPEFFGLLLVSE